MADSNRVGAFSLSDVRQRSLDGYWETLKTNSQYLWIIGGTATPNTVSRLDLASDLTQTLARGSLTLGHDNGTAFGTQDYGWTAGGTNQSNIDRITYSNDSAASLTRTTLPAVVASGAGIGNSTYGWTVAGGPSPATVSTIYRLTYQSDTTASASRGNINVGRFQVGGFSTEYAGWAVAGYNSGSSPLSSIERIDLANDLAIASVRGPLVSAKASAAGTSNNDSYGYLSGGFAGANVSNVDRVDLQNDTAIALSRGFATSAKSNAAGGGTSSRGWYAAGYNGSVNISSIDRIDYSNDTVRASIRGNLPAITNLARALPGIAAYLQYPGNISTATNYTTSIGYGWWGGGGPAAYSYVDRLDFANDTGAVASLRSPLSQLRHRVLASSNASFGWFSGGYNPSIPSTFTTIDRINFASDLTTISVRGYMANSRYNGASTGNSNYGYVSGGSSPSTTAMDRIDYSADSVTITRGNMTLARGGHSATGNADYAYWAGGTPSNSSVERTDYSNDIISNVLRGSLSATKYRSMAVGNNAYGWHAGGLSPQSTTIYRIDYSSDLATAPARGSLTSASQGGSASGNDRYGWFAQGITPVGPAVSSTIDRIDFSNDNVATSTRGQLYVARFAAGSVSNYVKENTTAQFGTAGASGPGTKIWSQGGQNFTARTEVDRIDIMTDTATALARGQLDTAKYYGVGLTEGNYGWNATGYPNPGGNSSVSRVTYSNDTTVMSARSPSAGNKYGAGGLSNLTYGYAVLGSNPRADRIEFKNDTSIGLTRVTSWNGSYRFYVSSISAKNYGYIASGKNPSFPATTIIERLDFSNDWLSASTRGGMSARTGAGGSSNTTYGWFSGGYNAGQVSTVERLDLSSDTTTAIARGPLIGTRAGISGGGNLFYGYAIGGLTGAPSSLVERIDYSSDSTTASTRGPLSVARTVVTSESNISNAANPVINVPLYNIGAATVGTSGAQTYGWFVGGATPTVASTIERITFSNDLITASIRSPLSLARTALASAGNANYGWNTAGATGPSSVTSVDRIDYSNDLTTAVNRSNLTIARYNHSGFGNANYGWFGSGTNPVSTGNMLSSVDRVDYSSDLVNSIIRGPIQQARRNSAATSNGNYGWFGGGYFDGTVMLSSTNRVDFSNDIDVARARGPLTLARFILTGVGNSAYGWIGGGLISPASTVHSTVERIDYSNDSSSIPARSPLSLARRGCGGASNSSFGWFSSGASPTLVSTVDRIGFASDSIVASVRGSLFQARSELTGTSDYVK